MEKCARRENGVMRALYLLGIVFVVDGHTTLGNYFDLNGLFRYYSFHLMLFAFGAGYFIRDGEEDHPARFLLRRAKRLLLPLYLWNVVYGVGAALLRRFAGFEFGQPLSAYTLLLAPLTDGEHFVYNLGSWFVFPLFLSQALYVLVRACSRLWKRREGVTFLACLLPGAVCVQLLYGGAKGFLPLFLLRALILLPGCALGALYRRRLEKRDTLPTVPYLLGICATRALLSLRYENLAYLLSDCSYFVCDAVGVYLGGALAIAFWLRVARLIAPFVEKSRLALSVGRHTYEIMMHHYMGFFAVNGAFLLMNMLGIGAADFSVHAFRTQGGYMYAPGGHAEVNLFYVLAGLLLPLGVSWAAGRAKALAKGFVKRAKA